MKTDDEYAFNLSTGAVLAESVLSNIGSSYDNNNGMALWNGACCSHDVIVIRALPDALDVAALLRVVHYQYTLGSLMVSCSSCVVETCRRVFSKCRMVKLMRR